MKANKYGGVCPRCKTWVSPGEGKLMGLLDHKDDDYQGYSSSYFAVCNPCHEVIRVKGFIELHSVAEGVLNV